MLTNKPKYMREGQTIFSFLAWMIEKGYLQENQSVCIGDPFYISDDKLNRCYEEYLTEFNSH